MNADSAASLKGLAIPAIGEIMEDRITALETERVAIMARVGVIDEELAKLKPARDALNGESVSPETPAQGRVA